MTRGRFFLSLVLVTVIGAAAAAWLAAPGIFAGKLRHMLSQYGYTDTAIADTAVTHKAITFSGIDLDKDGFSTIGTVTTDFGFRNITIDDLTLTGETGDATLYPLSIAGWDSRTLPRIPDADSLTVTAAKLDLTTGAGGIRLESKGRIAHQPDGRRTIEAALWGEQKQLSVDTRWAGFINADGAWQMDGEIQQARLQTDHLAASRISGWLSLKGGPQGMNSAGQIVVGSIRFGDKTALANATLTVEGPPDRYHLILNGDIAGYKDMRLLAELRQGKDDLQIQASIDTDSLDDLMAFVRNLHADLQKTPSKAAVFATLLLTPGNLDRVRADLKHAKYERLELVVNGVPYDLVGKIVAKQPKDGADQNSVVSLSPVN